MPTFSAQHALGKMDEMRSSLASALRGMFLLALPASVGLILLSEPTVSMLFQRGEFTVTIEPRYVPDFSTRLRKLDGSPSTIYDQPKANPLDEAAKRLLDDPGEEITYTAEQQKLLREVQELQKKKGI